MTIRATIHSGICALMLALAAPGQAEPAAARVAAETVWLYAHNAERAQFGSEPLRWNSQLAADARQWAEQLARENSLRHSPQNARGDTGENLWMGTAARFHPAQMIDSFAREKRHFHAGTFPKVSRTGNWADVGHYTQLVWGDTREVGCASARGAEFDVLVCRYWPAGNIIGTAMAPRQQVAQQ